MQIIVVINNALGVGEQRIPHTIYLLLNKQGLNEKCFIHLQKFFSLLLYYFSLSKRLRAEYALQTLKDKCLAEVETCFDVTPIYRYEPRYFLRMHDQLRDLGRAMADNETSHPRRLWRPEDHVCFLCELNFMLVF